MSAGHPQVRQGEQRDQLSGVLSQAAETYLGVAELPLNYPERVLDFGSYLRLDLLDLALGLVQGLRLLKCL